MWVTGSALFRVHPGQGTSGSLCGGWAGPAGACCALTHPLFSGCRGLRFIQVFLQSICDGERDENHPNLIRVNATKAYEMALKKYHGWIVQKIFQVSHPAGAEGPLVVGFALRHTLRRCGTPAPCPCLRCPPWAQEGLSPVCLG